MRPKRRQVRSSTEKEDAKVLPCFSFLVLLLILAEEGVLVGSMGDVSGLLPPDYFRRRSCGMVCRSKNGGVIRLDYVNRQAQLRITSGCINLELVEKSIQGGSKRDSFFMHRSRQEASEKRGAGSSGSFAFYSAMNNPFSCLASAFVHVLSRLGLSFSPLCSPLVYILFLYTCMFATYIRQTNCSLESAITPQYVSVSELFVSLETAVVPSVV